MKTSKTIILFLSLVLSTSSLFGISTFIFQADSLKNDTIKSSLPDSINNKEGKSMSQKMEHLFKIIPVPMYSYSSDGGHLFGLAKFNSFQLSKKDTVSKASIISGVASFTSEGRINASIATQLVFNDDKTILKGFVNYRKQPEYLTKIGNTLYLDNEGKVDSIEAITYERLRFGATVLFLAAKNLYVGGIFMYANYMDIKTDSSSFLVRDNAPGLSGGTDFGVGLAGAYDSRDNRYNSAKGGYVLSTILFYPEFLGSSYQFTQFVLDARKFFNPWYKHVIALQATTNFSNHDVPFYNLSLLGGDDKMRGYYQGFLRDKVLVDAQIEYRMPVWKMFGIAGWVASGRTAPDYKSLSLNGFHWSYGGGLRIKVDSKNDINMRLDFGFGPHGISGTYINFAEAF